MNFHLRQMQASSDPTEAPAAAFDDADERLSELEDARAEVEAEVEDMTKELQDKQRELEKAIADEGRQQAEVAKFYNEWRAAYDSLEDNADFTDLNPVSEFARGQLI
jgi:Skp family chaperone for outer membrane proteins